MSDLIDFNRINDCNKINPECINAYTDLLSSEDSETTICLHTSWNNACVDLLPLIKAGESCTTLYLSPDTDPNCLVYEPEEKCGDNICIHGDDLSRIISMQHLKDVSGDTPTDGVVYMYNETTNLFEPFDLKTALTNLSTNIQNLTSRLSNLINRVVNIEEKLTPPEGAPDDVKVVFGNINEYSDPNAVVDSTTGEATALDKTHGFYSHALSDEVYGDELFG